MAPDLLDNEPAFRLRERRVDFQRLRWALFFSFFFVAILPLLTLGRLNKVNSEDAVRERSALHLRSLAEKGSQLVNRFLSERLSDLRLLANSLTARDLANRADLADRLALVQRQYGVYRRLLVVAPNGEPIAGESGDALDADNLAGAEWFPKSIDGIEQRSEVFLDEARQTPLMMIVVPVSGAAAKPIAALIGVIELTFIETLFEQTAIEDTGELYLLDQHGRFLTSTRFGVTPLQPQRDGVDDRARCPVGTACLQKDYRGEDVLSARETLPGFGWEVVAEQDWNEIRERLYDVERRFVIWGLLLLAIVLTVAFVVSSRIAAILQRSYEHQRELESQVLQQEKLVSMGLLTAGMAHELNTPIANALVYTQMLIEEMTTGPEAAAKLEMLRTVEEEIRHVSRILRNLLEFSRRPPAGEECTDVNAVIRRLLDIANISLTHPGVKVVADYERNLPLAHADPSILKQVLANLVANALDAMPEGGALRIATRVVKALKKVTVDVSDTGAGIPAEDLDKVFQPFYSTKPHGEGMGLGLFVSYGMIRRLGGNIKVISAQKSDPPKDHTSWGATFTVELPIAEATADGKAIRRQGEKPR